jgi:hypothetical protein
MDFLFPGNAKGAIAMTVASIQACGENPKFNFQSQWNPETYLFPVCSA